MPRSRKARREKTHKVVIGIVKSSHTPYRIQVLDPPEKSFSRQNDDIIRRVIAHVRDVVGVEKIVFLGQRHFEPPLFITDWKYVSLTFLPRREQKIKIKWVLSGVEKRVPKSGKIRCVILNSYRRSFGKELFIDFSSIREHTI